MHSPPHGGAQAKARSSDEAHVSPTQVLRGVFNGTQVDQQTENKKLDGLALACTCLRKQPWARSSNRLLNLVVNAGDPSVIDRKQGLDLAIGF